jgi:hypothetical protein
VTTPFAQGVELAAAKAAHFHALILRQLNHTLHTLILAARINTQRHARLGWFFQCGGNRMYAPSKCLHV